ncbi:MAG: hypothetical protein JNG84_08885, partial [Archangium sp.]|nr:hypothetical protein [Archangium sp.]
MSWPLIKKELAEHGWVFAIALALSVAVLFICLTSKLNDGRFSALSVHLKVALLGTAMVAGNRLVVREYLERTRLFLEALPVPRATVLRTKWLLGATYVVGSAAVLTAITARYVGKTEVITANDVAHVFSRAALAGLGCWSAAFLAGIVGHARMLFWVTLLGGVPVLASALNTEAFRMPPFSLLGDHFGAAQTWPTALECTSTLAWSVLSTGTAALMVLSRDGAIAQAMTRKIAARDFVVVAAVLFTFGALAKALEVRAERPPFTLTSAVHGKRTSVSTTEEVDEALALKLATRLDHALGDLETALGIDLRTLWVIPSRGLSPNRVARLPHPANGPVAAANITH